MEKLSNYSLPATESPEIKLSARLKAAVKALESKGQDPSIVVQNAIEDAIRDGRAKAGGFGAARRHVDYLMDSVHRLSEQGASVATERRFGENRKERRQLKRLQHKESRREVRKEKRKRAKNDFYSKP